MKTEYVEHFHEILYDALAAKASALQRKLTAQEWLDETEKCYVHHHSGHQMISAEEARQIYDVYPRKVGKAGAIAAIQRIRISPAKLLEATTAFALCVARWPANEKQYIPHPATWFNRGSYDDDPKEWLRGGEAMPSQFNKTYT